MFDEGPGRIIANVMLLMATGWIALGGVGLCWQGLWVIGAPMALGGGILFLRSLVKRPPWQMSDPDDPGRID